MPQMRTNIFLLGKCLISWQSIKKQVVALSSYEVSTVVLLILQLRISGSLGCSAIFLEEMLK
jgi:hypothetical protein